jgi:predicted metal-dependent HD superfamily phosphohydrolase
MTVAQPSTLQRYWNELLSAARIPAELGASTFAELCCAYQEAHRHYHTLQHLEHMLGLVYASGNAHPEALWATWYHDYVYSPGHSDNEQRSAELARTSLTRLAVAEPLIARIEQIILATRSHTFAGIDPVLQGVLDADMAVLGTPPDQYQQYCEQVRREFGRLPDLVFHPGRQRFLEQVLAQEKIFATEWFWQRFEAQARANLSGELASK